MHKAVELGYVNALEELLDTLRRKRRRDYLIAAGGGRMLDMIREDPAHWAVLIQQLRRLGKSAWER